MSSTGRVGRIEKSGVVVEAVGRKFFIQQLSLTLITDKQWIFVVIFILKIALTA